MDREIDVECPCCRARLSVDTGTRKVLRVSGPPGAETKGTDAADFDALARKVRERRAGGESAFDSALERERRRGQDLDDRFRRAADRIQGSKAPPPDPD